MKYEKINKILSEREMGCFLREELEEEPEDNYKYYVVVSRCMGYEFIGFNSENEMLEYVIGEVLCY